MFTYSIAIGLYGLGGLLTVGFLEKYHFFEEVFFDDHLLMPAKISLFLAWPLVAIVFISASFLLLILLSISVVVRHNTTQATTNRKTLSKVWKIVYSPLLLIRWAWKGFR